MRNLTKLIIAFAIMLISVSNSYSQSTVWKYLNFECGGFVSYLLPVKYTGGVQPSNLSNQVIYARTDIGGFWRSGDNGVTWDNVTCYFRNTGTHGAEFSPSETHIQGLAVRDAYVNPNNGADQRQIILAAWGHEVDDAASSIIGSVGYQCIWRSTNNGHTFTWSRSTIQSPGVMFKGNNLYIKMGGECIVYDPNNINGEQSVVYMGGAPPPGAASKLYKSTDDGQTWNHNTAQTTNFPGTSSDTIICIAMDNQLPNHIWVGTTQRILFTTNAGANWTERLIKDPNNTTVTHPCVKRIILKNAGGVVTAFATWGDGSATGISRFKSNNSYNCEDLTTEFGPNSGGDVFSALAFADDNEGVIVAGQYYNDLKTTTDDGSTWSAAVRLKYTSGYSQGNPNFHNFPNHQDPDELDPQAYMYDGLGNITRNPNSGWGSQWYLGGGAGGRKTAPSHGVSGTNFADSRWQYTVKGQTMPVVYDVVFHTFNFSGQDKDAIFLPISDWTMGWEYTQNLSDLYLGSLIEPPLKYDRQITEQCNYDTYISNVTRILFNPDDPNLAYCVGGSIYDFSGSVQPPCDEDKFAGFYQRRDNDGSGSNFTLARKENGPFLNIPNRAIVDAIMYKTPGNANRIIALVGESDSQSQPNGSNLGIFYSDNGGDSWGTATFDETSDNPNMSTEDAYNNSNLPSLTSAINGTIGEVFDGHFSLAHGPGSIVYLWLESSSGSSPYFGGLFVSLNNGQTWASISEPHTGYKGPGSLKYLGNNEIALAVQGFGFGQKGLYKGTINTTNGSVSWNQLGNFESADHLDVQNGKWAVYGKRSGDNFNQIYKSLDNGSSWTRIPFSDPLPLFGKVHSLRIRPGSFNNELWIATSGQGAYVYSEFQDATNPPPYIVSSNQLINNSVYFDRDIIIESGAELTLDGSSHPYNNIFFEMGKNRKIIVESGGKLIADNVTFQSRDTNFSWEGIKLENASVSLDIDNCTFKHFKTGINFDYGNNFFSSTPHYVKNSTFIVKFDGSKAIYAKNIHKLICTGNTFNIWSGSNKAGVIIQNWLDENQGDGLPGGGPQIDHQINFVSNNFNGGALQLYVGGYSTTNIDCYIAWNQLNNANGLCFGGRLTGGEFKNNILSSVSQSTTSNFWQSDMKLFGNNISNTSSSGTPQLLTLNGSFLKMEPLRTGGDFVWDAGKNSLSNQKGDNVSIVSGFPYVDYGRNQFTIYNPNSFHFYGSLSDLVFSTRDFPAAYNCWSGNGGVPKSYLYTSTVNPVNLSYSPINPTCAELSSPTPTITDLGFGYYDTLYTTDDNTSPPPSDDYVLSTQAYEHMSEDNWIEAITNFKNLINDNPTSSYTDGCLYDLYDCHVELDTTNEQANTDIIFGTLKAYLVDKINSSSYSKDFADAAYQVILLCEAKLDEYEEALDGYEFIALFHPDPEVRLFASYDYALMDSLINGGQGGGLDSKTDLTTISMKRYERFNKLFNDKPLLSRMKEIYENDSKHGKGSNSRDQKSFENSSDVKSKSLNRVKIDDASRQELNNKTLYNLSFYNSLSREEKEASRVNDIFLLIGLRTEATDNNEGNNLPFKFELAQNYPNPFNPSTTIQYSLPKNLQVKIKVYDVIGREMATLVNELQKPGVYSVKFDGSRLASGVYFYRIVAGDFVETKRMVLVK